MVQSRGTTETPVEQSGRERPAAPAPIRAVGSSLGRLGEKLFPVKPGPVPPWTRVVSLIFLMAIIWEIMWLLTFWSSSPTHDMLGAWAQASKLLPIAVVMATIGAVPGFWLMRRRMQAVNIAAGLPADGKVVKPARGAPRQQPATVHASSRGRRRHTIGKKRARR